MNWLGSIRQWHWVSSAICLVGMLGFAVTGITLNHAGQIEAAPTLHAVEAILPEAELAVLRGALDGDDFDPQAPLPAPVRQWLESSAGIRTGQRGAEWSRDEVYLAMARPGGDAWLSIDLASGELLYEDTDRGWISYLNDLHKGRNTGAAWSWFIDLFSLASIVFCVTGLVLLYRYRRVRPFTWPAVGFGFLLPALLALLFVHQ